MPYVCAAADTTIYCILTTLDAFTFRSSAQQFYLKLLVVKLMETIFENNVLQQQPFKPMIIVVDTTKVGSASNTFVPPIIKATSETVKIYWGDGTSPMGVNGDNTHVYAVRGVYTVKIESKCFGGIYFNDGAIKPK